MAAILLRRASSSSLIPIATRLVGCFSSALHLRNRLVASRFLPFSTGSVIDKSPPEPKFRKLIEAPRANVHAKLSKNGKLFLDCGFDEEAIKILVEEKIHDDYSETDAEKHCLQMHIKYDYGARFSKHVEFDVSLPYDQGQVAIQNSTTSVDDYFRECFLAHMDDFKALLEKRGFNYGLIDFVFKCAKKLKEIKKCRESNTESVHAEVRELTLYWETKEETIEIRVDNFLKDDEEVGYSWMDDEEEDTLYMEIIYCYGDGLRKQMNFLIRLPDYQSQMAIESVTASLDEYYDDFEGHFNELTELLEKRGHFNELTELLEKRGLNSSNLDFVVKYAAKAKEVTN